MVARPPSGSSPGQQRSGRYVLALASSVLVSGSVYRVAAQPASRPGDQDESGAGETTAAGAVDAGQADPSRPADPASSDGEVIVITGNRGDRPLDEAAAMTEVIRRDQIEASGAETAAAALQNRPGLSIDRAIGGTGVSMQGLGPEYVLVLVDGQRQVGRVGGVLDLDRLGVGDLEQIEIVRGPSSVLYGSDALGGVINLVTRDPEKPEAEVAARADSRGGTDARGRVAGGTGGWFGAVSSEWRRGPAFDRTPDDPATTLSAYDDRRAAVRGGYHPGDRLRLEVAADYLRRDLDGVDATGSGAVFDRRNLTEVANLRLGSRSALSDSTRLRAAVAGGFYRDQFVNDQRGSAELDEDQDTRENLLEATVQVESAIGSHIATGGGEVLFETIRSPRLATGDAERWRLATFAQDEWWIGRGQRLLLVPAARLDHDSQFGTHVTPQVALRWEATARLAGRTSVGLGYRAPGFRELYLRFENPGAGYVVDGNPDLGPETSRSVQLGGEYQATDRIWFALHGFWNDIDDLITPLTVGGGGEGEPLRFSYDNVGRARTRGTEAMATVRRGRLSAELGWTHTRAENRDDGRALDGVPRNRASAALRWRDQDMGLDGSVEAGLTGGRPFFLSAEAPTRATWTDRRVDLRARAAKSFGWLTVFAGGDNLLDAGDDTFDPIAPRTFYGGLSARL